MKYDVVALGELLIDFTPNGVSSQGNTVFEANPGGAPCNVLSMLCKFGKKTAFIGKLGNDMFGQMLKDTISEIGIETKAVTMSKDVNTTLAFVKIDEQGERSFAFYRNPGADMRLTEEEVDESIIQDAKIFHFGTLSMTHEGVRKATKKAIDIAKKNKKLISFDPNLRPPLWNNLDEAREQIEYGCSVCDILKIEDQELKFLTGKETIEEGVENLKEDYNISLIMVTAGIDGSYAFYKENKVYKPAFVTEKTIDTTGAGDTFCGCSLAYILEHGLDGLERCELEEMLTFANAAASIVTTRKGAIKSMPEIEEVKAWIKCF